MTDRALKHHPSLERNLREEKSRLSVNGLVLRQEGSDALSSKFTAYLESC